MKNEYTAVVKQEGDCWVGWIEEIPGVNCQEKAYEELEESLEITLREALEFNRQDVVCAAFRHKSKARANPRTPKIRRTEIS
ncbi:MAG: type II toxin-antitoxin system HicB family antitoxin [bacterium]